MENSFGMLANRFRCLHTTMVQAPKTVEGIVMAAVILHNIMRDRYPALQNAVADREGPDGAMIPGEWRDGRALDDLLPMAGGNFGSAEAKRMREYLREYYDTHPVPWQQNLEVQQLPEVHVAQQ